MKELYFKNIMSIGNLYLNKVLNRFEDEDIIFVCTDDNNKYYFCVCYEFRCKLSWVVCEVTLQDLIKMLYKYIDMHTLFKTSNKIIQIEQIDNITNINFTEYSNININYLPKENTYLKQDINIDDYLRELASYSKITKTQNYERYIDYPIYHSYLSCNDEVLQISENKYYFANYDLPLIQECNDTIYNINLNQAA